MFSLVFTRRYSMAHRLMADARSKCAVPHGHNELVTVKLQAIAARRLDGVANMVEPFEIAKGCWNRWIDEEVDHALQLSDRDPLIGYFREHEPDRLARLLVTPGDPTTEMLAACFMAKLNAFLAQDGSGLRCPVTGRVYPYRNGVLDLLEDGSTWTATQQVLTRPVMAWGRL